MLMKKVVFDALQSRCKQFATEFLHAKKGGYDVTGRLQQIEQIEKTPIVILAHLFYRMRRWVEDPVLYIGPCKRINDARRLVIRG